MNRLNKTKGVLVHRGWLYPNSKINMFISGLLIFALICVIILVSVMLLEIEHSFYTESFGNFISLIGAISLIIISCIGIYLFFIVIRKERGIVIYQYGTSFGGWLITNSDVLIKRLSKSIWNVYIIDPPRFIYYDTITDVQLAYNDGRRINDDEDVDVVTFLFNSKETKIKEKNLTAVLIVLITNENISYHIDNENIRAASIVFLKTLNTWKINCK